MSAARTESESPMIDMQVAQTILQQLGGKRFIVMTGAHSFSGSSDALTFKIPEAKDGIRAVRITLTCSDDYEVEFLAMRGSFEGGDLRCEVVARFEGIYFDQLEEIFERETGLATSLTMRRAQ